MDFYQSLYTFNTSNNLIFSGIYWGYWIIYIISCWKIFKKAGQPGWKAIIPVYNIYIPYKIAWKARWFVFGMIGSIVCGGLIAFSIIDYLETNSTATLPLIITSLFLLIVLFIIAIIFNYKLSKAFGHGIGFCIGLTLLYPVFMLILAFGSSKYDEETAKAQSGANRRQSGEKNKPSSLKDFFYDKNDIIVVLIIVAVAGFIIYTRIGAIMDYPETLAKKTAATETTETVTQSSSDDQSGSSSSAAVTITITDSDTSVTVAAKIYKAGLVTSDTEFQSYISNAGKEDSLKSGTFQIPNGSSNEEILNIIAN